METTRDSFTRKLNNKLMKRQENANLIIKVLKKDGNITGHTYNALMNTIQYESTLYLRPSNWSHKGRSLKDYTYYIITILQLGGYSYKIGNDAPQGGQTGNYIKVTKKGKQFISDVIRYL